MGLEMIRTCKINIFMKIKVKVSRKHVLSSSFLPLTQHSEEVCHDSNNSKVEGSSHDAAEKGIQVPKSIDSYSLRFLLQ